MPKQTSLYQLHLELGGKMIEFAGYQLPVQYQSGIIQEHLHCRSRAGFFDISHMGQCLILGGEAAAELEKLTPSDVTSLKPGQQKYTVLTNDEGGIIDDIIITRTGKGLMIVVNAACKDKDFQYLSSHLSGGCQLLELTERSLFALQGPSSQVIMEKFSPSATALTFMHACEAEIAGIKCTISRSGYTGEDGFEISVENRQAEDLARLLLAEPEVAPIGLGARDTLRLEAGLCLYGHEISESVTPVEAGLNWLIKKNHNKFPGADKIIQQLEQGPEKIRVGLIAEGKQPVREGCAVYDEKNNMIGHVTSGSFSPSLGKPVAMALIERSYTQSGVRLTAKVREHQIPVCVTSLPFIPHRYRR